MILPISGRETSILTLGWRGQQRLIVVPTESVIRSILITSDHIGTRSAMLVLPMIKRPCCAWLWAISTHDMTWMGVGADLKRTFIRFLERKNTTFPALLLLARETIIILASSPWKLSLDLKSACYHLETSLAYSVDSDSWMMLLIKYDVWLLRNKKTLIIFDREDIAIFA